MSTRSIIIFTGKDQYKRSNTIRLYQHCDGYPTGVLPHIEAAIEKSEELLSTHATRFKEKEKGTIPPSTLAALYIGDSSDVYGAAARVQLDSEHAFDVRELGNQGDLEWIYVVDAVERTVCIYGGGYTGQSPQAAFKRGTVDPMKYANALKEEYQERERTQIQKLVTYIEAWGYKVNPKKVRTKKAKALKLVVSS
jgi:hypothetical protein